MLALEEVRVKRLLAVMALGVSLFAVVPGPVDASTDYASFSPRSARPGKVVTVAVDPFNCPVLNAGPSSIRMVLFGPNAAPGAGPAHDVILSRTGENEYAFDVPSLPPGRYDVSMACFADGGLEDIVTNSDGGEAGFRILPSAPATSTASPEQRDAGPWPFPTLLLLCAACVIGTSLLIGRLVRRC
jgi:hypothetical protein